MMKLRTWHVAQQGGLALQCLYSDTCSHWVQDIVGRVTGQNLKLDTRTHIHTHTHIFRHAQ